MLLILLNRLLMLFMYWVICCEFVSVRERVYIIFEVVKTYIQQ